LELDDELLELELNDELLDDGIDELELDELELELIAPTPESSSPGKSTHGRYGRFRGKTSKQVGSDVFFPKNMALPELDELSPPGRRENSIPFGVWRTSWSVSGRETIRCNSSPSA
jgi:hypothetical protein